MKHFAVIVLLINDHQIHQSTDAKTSPHVSFREVEGEKRKVHDGK